ncbi:uncharacterized protein [Solanum tuberosum]|uniref:uncharacterized protein n=1 Tax=Solanum tuberosum TaxID=4113 RepID=UPI00073A0FD5|nr:PREDICTED: uncharacterized protein LOC107058757 [Solanum tuberosum]
MASVGPERKTGTFSSSIEPQSRKTTFYLFSCAIVHEILVIQLFVTGKELWGHIDGSDPAPTDATKLGEWKIKDAQVMTWILGSIDPLIVLNLRPYKTAKAMWDYLQKVYNQDNSARRFQLEYEIANYSQGGLSIHDYFSGFQNLWAEFTDIVYAKIPTESLSLIQAVHEQSKRDQFLMKLRSNFEQVFALT